MSSASRGATARSRLDKLGVRVGARVAVLRLDDRGFRRELATRTTDVVERRPRAGSDLILFRADRPADLTRLSRLKDALKPNGAIWVLWPKGREELKRNDIFDGAKEAGLVDVKIASFSETLSALKLVIPVADR